MGKKLNALSNGEDQNLSEAIRASAQQIWQAGLGAFSVAEKEGGKLFARLVKDGIDIQKRTRHLSDMAVPAVTDTVSKMAGTVNRQAGGSWEKIEKVFEERVAKTLTQLGVPTSRDLHELSRRIDELSMHVAKLVEPAVAPVSTAAPVTTRRSAKKAPGAATAAKANVKVKVRKPAALSVAAKRS